MTSSQIQAQPAQTQFYNWHGYRCAYEYLAHGQGNGIPNQSLLLIHPIGVGLSRHFWYPFCNAWVQSGQRVSIYNPDLLGCGDSAMPHVAYFPSDWASQLVHFIKTVIQHPVIVVVQGALFPVALRMVELTKGDLWVEGLVLAGPPGWNLISQPPKPVQQKVLWNLLFDNVLGSAFYRYARRRAFLESFSRRQLFASDTIDDEWLDMLEEGAQDLKSRYAVFSFLAGFWRTDYTNAITDIQQPTLVLFGKEASGIDRASQGDSAQKRLDDYLQHLPNAQGKLIEGRNVLPYEATEAFVDAVVDWLGTI